MQKNQEYIEQFLKGELNAEQMKDIDHRIMSDPEFASEVAFHISAGQALRARANDELKERFRSLYFSKAIVLRPVWRYAAAAAVIACIVTGVFFFYSKPSAELVADNYIKSNLATLGVSMSNTADSMQTAIALYNEGKLEEAEEHFETILKSAPENYKAREYSGIVSLRLGNYDKALAHFDTLSKATHLYANSGSFYYAITLLKRNRPGDVKNAKTILQQIVTTQGTNHRAAGELLKQL